MDGLKRDAAALLRRGGERPGPAKLAVNRSQDRHALEPLHGDPGPTIENRRTEREEPQMPTTTVTNWIRAGLVGLPLAGALTFWSSLCPHPAPNARAQAWPRSVTPH